MTDRALFRTLNPSSSIITFSNADECLGDRCVLYIQIAGKMLDIRKSAWELVAPAQCGGMQRQEPNVWTLRIDDIDLLEKVAMLVNFGNNDAWEPQPAENLEVTEVMEYLDRHLDYMEFAATWAGSYRFFFAVADQIAQFCRRLSNIEYIAGALLHWDRFKGSSDYLRDELLSVVFERLDEFGTIHRGWGMQLLHNGFWKDFLVKFSPCIRNGAIVRPFENAWLILNRGALQGLSETMRRYNYAEAMQHTTEAMQATTIADNMNEVD